ncbi:MAG: phosphatidylserine decarboxylase family protein [Nitrospirae bacterium]|nr:phosphatidylserine decarboxylase family protein [Nitrospirota bacterium]
MLKIAPDGYPFILIFVLLSILVFIFAKPWLTIFPLIVTMFMCLFFRDPERDVPSNKGIFVSPADGKVILIRDVYEKDYLKAESKEISIFMSLFNVHINRSPCDGKVTFIKHSAGKFFVAHKDIASLENENNVIVIEGEYGKILVRQVAGFIARRIVCRVKTGDVLRRGERYGMIKFGSRLDIYLPNAIKIKVKVGDKVRAGETILGEI